MSLTYAKYLEVEKLLELQVPRSGQDWSDAEHDEHLFIVIHQVYELWFKQVLHELDYLGHLFDTHRAENDLTPRIRYTLKRVLTILKTMVGQVDILETMTPMSFASFRSRLETASGFQSAQFRELEFLLGQRRQSMIQHHAENPPAVARLERRMTQPPLYQYFLRYLLRCGYDIPEGVLVYDRESPIVALAEVQPELIRMYKTDDARSQVAERLVDFDEGLQEWRYRHVKMVERTIGTKPGTGGSPGAMYLRQTLFNPVFPDLWEIRAEL